MRAAAGVNEEPLRASAASACFRLEADQSESRSGRTQVGRSLRFLENGPLTDDQFQQEQSQSDQDENLMQWIHSSC